MARNKLTVDFKGFKEMFEKLDRLNADTRKITEEALKKSFETVTPGIEAAIKPYYDTGATEDSLTKNANIKWEGRVGSVEVGFDIKNGGLPSIFLMYGTPRHAVGNQYGRSGSMRGTTQDMTLYNSIYGTSTKNKVRKVQKEIFDKALKEAMG